MEDIAWLLILFLVLLQQHFIASPMSQTFNHQSLRLANHKIYMQFKGLLYSRVCWLNIDTIFHGPFVLSTVEHFRLLLPKGRGHHWGAGQGGGCSSSAGRGARRDPESALWPRSSLWLPVAVPVRQVGWAVRGPAACRSEECRPDAFLHHRCTRDITAAANMAHCGLEGSNFWASPLFFSWYCKIKTFFEIISAFNFC